MYFPKFKHDGWIKFLIYLSDEFQQTHSLYEFQQPLIHKVNGFVEIHKVNGFVITPYGWEVAQ